MAAPVKKGIDYFTHDIGMITDRKLKPVKVRFGGEGLALWLVLLELIYGDKGYYIEYNDTLLWDIIDALGGKEPLSFETAGEIIRLLVDCGLFDKESFEKNILTSKRIQKQYLQATARRRSISINRDIWLLTLDEIKEDYSSHPIFKILDDVDKNCENVNNNSQNVSNNPENVDNYSQSRVEKSRVEKIREDKSRVDESREEEKREEKAGQHSADSPPPPPITEVVFNNTSLPQEAQNTAENREASPPQYINYPKTEVVKLTLSEYNELCRDYTMKDINRYIEKIDLYLKSKNKTYSDYKTAVLRWLIDDNVSKKSARSFDIEQIERESLLHTPKLKKP